MQATVFYFSAEYNIVFFLLSDNSDLLRVIFYEFTRCCPHSSPSEFHLSINASCNPPPASVWAPVWSCALAHVHLSTRALLASKGMLLSHEEEGGVTLNLFRLKMLLHLTGRQ